MSQVVRHRLTVVHAPAGSGKTTALAQFAREAGIPVAWYTVDTLDGAASTFLAYLQRAIERAVGADEAPLWPHADAALLALESLGRPLAVVIDDFHLIAGDQTLTMSPTNRAGEVFTYMVARLPDDISFAIGTRVAPTLNDAGLSLMDDVLEIDADDLRFRTWEAERLLDESWGFLLRPDDVSRLTRSVGGWAAGFQLFRLAARDRTPAEQRRLARHASTRSRLARRYLTQHVLGALSDDQRTFLLHTSVLGVVTPELADDLLEREGSAADLALLEASEVFVTRLDADTYRYHEVLRSHLEAELAETVAADVVEARYARAAELLESAGYFGEAMRCQVRSGRPTDPARLARLAGGEVGLRNAGLLDELEPGEHTVGGDPWLLLVRARATVAAGRFRQASAVYRQAEEQLGDHPEAVSTCRSERRALESFLQADAHNSDGWLGLLLAGLTDAPLAAAEALADLGTVEALIASGALSFLAGDLDTAGRRFDAVLLADAPADWVIHTGRLGRQLVRLLSGDADSSTLAVVDRLLVGLDGTWLGRLGGAVAAAAANPPRYDVARRLADRCADDGDPWGAIVGHLCAGLIAADPEACSGHFRRAAALAEGQRSAVLLCSALAGAASADADADTSAGTDAIMRANELARRCGLQRPPLVTLVQGVAPNTRPARDATDAPSTSRAADPSPTRCTGGFAVAPRHDVLDTLRPRARAVLMRLAVDAGRTVSVDTLIDDVWPANDATGRRGIQVAVSAIRRGLHDDGADRTIDRVDDGYVLTMPSGGTSDLDDFRCGADEVARAADPAARLAAAERAMLAVHGELLPNAGSADWVVGARDQFAQQVARVAASGAAAAIEVDDEPAAIRLAEIGLEFDRYHDDLWRITIDAHERRDDAISAERLRRQHAAVLDELGVEPAGRPSSVSLSTGTRAR